MFYHSRLYCVFFILFVSTLVLAEDLVVTSVSLVKDWQPNLTQTLTLEVILPKKFHAYTDQFRILNIKPDGFKVGEIKATPNVEFYDKFSKKKRKGLFEKGRLTLLIEAPEIISDPLQKVTFDLRHQICSESVCFLPKNVSISVSTSKFSTPNEALLAPVKESFSLLKSFERAMQTSLFFSFLSVFIAGVLTSFTPCIFPMLPITISILGYHADHKSRLHNFSRALAYVLGIAITYSSMGVVAALTGSLFGSALSNKYILSALVILFFAMSLSMWGAFEMQAPAFIRNRLGSGKSRGLSGALFMGMVAGLVASPCVGPVLVSILSYVSTTKDVLLGFSLLFTFAMGLGLIFIVIGLFSSTLKLLPKSGRWMEFIKFILGAGMWGAALYYTQFIFNDRWWTALIAASFVALSIWKGAFRLRKNILLQGTLLILFTFSTSILMLSIFKPQTLENAFHLTTKRIAEASPEWAVYSEEALIEAEKMGQPVMIDFFAEWCAACHELEEKTFSTPEFKALSQRFRLLRFDATEDNEKISQVLRKYQVKGLPTVLFINRNGILLKELTFTQFLEMKELGSKMQEALK